MCACSVASVVLFFVILWTVAHEAPLAMEFSRQEYWSGGPCPSPGDLLDPEIEPLSLMSPAWTGRFFTTSATWETHFNCFKTVLTAFTMLCNQYHDLIPEFLHHPKQKPQTHYWAGLLTGKDPDAGKDWRQEENGTTENEMIGWHHSLNGREFEQAQGDSEGQRSLTCCSSWGLR